MTGLVWKNNRLWWGMYVFIAACGVAVASATWPQEKERIPRDEPVDLGKLIRGEYMGFGEMLERETDPDMYAAGMELSKLFYQAFVNKLGPEEGHDLYMERVRQGVFPMPDPAWVDDEDEPIDEVELPTPWELVSVPFNTMDHVFEQEPPVDGARLKIQFVTLEGINGGWIITFRRRWE